MVMIFSSRSKNSGLGIDETIPFNQRDDFEELQIIPIGGKFAQVLVDLIGLFELDTGSQLCPDSKLVEGLILKEITSR